jgi:hypothetical protein
LKSCLFTYTIFFVFTIIVFPHANAQPSWESYENESCAISLMHPYKDDRISQGLGGTFQIISAKDIKDLDSLNMNITTSCLDERLPITEQSMNLTMSGLKEHFKLVTYEENSFNETLIDGEKASFVTVGGPTKSGEFFKAHTVTEMNHNNNTYIIRIVSSGNDGLSGFFNNHNYLKDNVISSIKFLK